MQKRSSVIDMTEGTPWKRIIQFAVPLFIGNIFQELYNAVDTLVVGRFEGNQTLAAVGAAGVPFMLVNALLIGFSVGAGILIGQYYGAKEAGKLKKAAGTVLIVSAILGLIVTVACYYCSIYLLRLLNVPDNLIPNSHLYLRTVGLFICPSIIYNNTAGMLRGIGNSRAALLFLAICAGLNTALDLVFVAVLKLGVFGVALATGIAQTVSAILIVGYLYLHIPELAAKGDDLRVNLPILGQVVRLGLPNAFQTAGAILGIVVLQRITNSFGDLVVAAYTVGNKIYSFAQLPVQSITSTVSTYTAQNIGANRQDRVKQGLSFALKMMLTFTCLASVAIVLSRRNLIGFFTNEPTDELQTVGGHHLIVCCGFFPFMAVMNIFQGLFNGAGNTTYSMTLTLALTILRIPMACFFVYALKMNYLGAWITLPISWAIGAVLAYIHYRRGAWKSKSVSLV